MSNYFLSKKTCDFFFHGFQLLFSCICCVWHSKYVIAGKLESCLITFTLTTDICCSFENVFASLHLKCDALVFEPSLCLSKTRQSTTSGSFVASSKRCFLLCLSQLQHTTTRHGFLCLKCMEIINTKNHTNINKRPHT